MAEKLWDRGDPLDGQIERFTVGRDPELDRELVAYDLLGDAAHAKGLAAIGVLTDEELDRLLDELRVILSDVRAGRFVIQQSDEDCHTAVENRLTSRLGDTGRKIHTGRSRNDQVLAMLRLYGREALLELTHSLLEVIAELLELAQRHRETSVAGYSHMRQAMPSTFGLLFGAHAEGMLDDVSWVQAAYRHLNRSPLGSASGYGVALPLDRPLVARLLGFDAVQANTLAVQNDRGKSEFLVLGVAAAIATDLSRLASDLLWFSSDEVAVVHLHTSVTTGSSSMPNKRNPDVLELVRATAAAVRARQAEVGAIYGPLMSGYHRDLQLTKGPLVESLRDVRHALAAMQRVLCTLELDGERARSLIGRASGATDAVYRRVAAGEPFRLAYRDVASDPAGAVSGDPAESWRDRTHLGAPGAEDKRAQSDLQLARHWLTDKQQRVAESWKLLEG